MTSTDDTETTEKTAKAVVRRYFEAFNDRDEDRLRELLAEDVVEHGVHREVHGVDDVVALLDAHFEPFPDYAGSGETVLAEDDVVAVRYTASGTHSGEYRDVPPTGHEVEWTGMAMYRIEDDRIAEIWIEEDRLGLLEQLELAEPPAHFRI